MTPIAWALTDLTAALRPAPEPPVMLVEMQNKPLTVTPVGEPETSGDRGQWRYEAGSVHIELRATRVAAHRVGILQATLRNRGSAPINFRWVHYVMTLPTEAQHWCLQTCGGGGAYGVYPPPAYESKRIALLEDGWHSVESREGGRSSNHQLPLVMQWVNSDAKQPGLWHGLEWSGQWFLSANRRDKGQRLRIDAGVKAPGLTLGPGETLALPAWHVGFFTDGPAAGTNAVRRYIYQHHKPDYLGERPYPRVSYDHWFGIDNRVSVPALTPQVKRAAELGVEMWCLDAGWFGDFPQDVGNWNEVTAKKFADGLEPLAELVRGHGMSFGLWFEPERAVKHTWAVREYPELFWPDPTGGDTYHLNLARTDAQDWLIDLLDGWIRRLDLRWSRWDYNIEPAGYWSAADPTGKIQFAYFAGLYRVIDEMRRRHPQWMIENCASGGRRIDLGLLNRTHTNWFSDHTRHPAICRWMQLRSQLFLPGCEPNSSVAIDTAEGDPADLDEAILSRFCGKLAFDGDVASLSPGATARFRHWTDLYKQYRHLLVQDFHQLSPIPQSLDDWDVVQFSAYDGSEALVAAFRTGGAEQMTLTPKGAEGWRWHDLGDGSQHRAGTSLPANLADRGARLWHGRRA